MKTRGRVRAAVAACVLGSAAFIAVSAVPATAQQRKLDKVQLQDAQALADAVEWAQAGRPAPSDIKIDLESYFFFRASNGQTYVPYTLSVDPAGFSSPTAAYLLRIVKKGAAPVARKDDKKPLAADRAVNDLNDLNEINEAQRTAAEADKGKKPPLPPASYEDLEFPTIKPDTRRIARAFQVAAGEYEVYIAMKERPADKKQKARIAVVKKELSVPDFNGPLATSSVIVADQLSALPAPLKPELQRENPFTIGQLQLTPKIGTSFAKKEELNVYFQVYNAGLDAAKKPDVLVEYVFFLKQAAGEKRAFSSEPSVLNATTLPAAFDPTRHQLNGGSGWPLAAFPTGEFRLEIKVTDKVTGKSLTQSVTFSVA